MKRMLVFATFLLGVSTAAVAGDVYHKGYVTKNGTYVAPHYQTAPDSTRQNNYSTQGNVNPYTGQAGRVNPVPETPSYPANSGYQAPTNPYEQNQYKNPYAR